ncbi:MAG: MlaD family protein [Caulobacterales bacterium]|uniref:MlaD family protein n=1 Tax=Glycocaulis sp. TaxID=1969725 RepID=UPI003F9F67E8
METRAHHALVGLFVILLALAGGLFFVWLSQVSFDREFRQYDVVFEGPVRGLRTASEVRFNGIQVGEVVDLGLNPDDTSEVIARVRVDASTPIRVDSFAQLEPQGLTGLSYIQISSGESGSALLETRFGDRPARIYARQTQLDLLVQGGETLLETVQTTGVLVNRLLNDENQEQFSLLLTNLATLSDQLAQNGAMMEELRTTLGSVEQAAQDMSTAATSIEQFGVTAERFLIDEVGPMVAETEAASIAVNQASMETYDALVALRPGLETFATDGVYQLNAASHDLRQLVANLERLTAELENDPGGLLTRSRGEEVEVPQ